MLHLLRTVRTRLRGDRGSATTEYAMIAMVGVAFAGVLYKLITSDTAKAWLAAAIMGKTPWA